MKNETKHTPGPWKVNPYGYIHGGLGFKTFIASPPNEEEARVGLCSFPGSEETLANAALIAAAPDLLAACKEIWEALDEWATERNPDLEEIASLREQAKQAIAKAEGRL